MLDFWRMFPNSELEAKSLDVLAITAAATQSDSVLSLANYSFPHRPNLGIEKLSTLLYHAHNGDIAGVLKREAKAKRAFSEGCDWGEDEDTEEGSWYNMAYPTYEAAFARLDALVQSVQ